MIVNPNKDFSFVSEILNLKTEAQFTIDLILKHFNGRITGKIDRKGWDYNKIQKVKYKKAKKTTETNLKKIIKNLQY